MVNGGDRCFQPQSVQSGEATTKEIAHRLRRLNRLKFFAKKAKFCKFVIQSALRNEEVESIRLSV